LVQKLEKREKILEILFKNHAGGFLANFPQKLQFRGHFLENFQIDSR
jgi:hypothetical protein